MRAMKLFVGDPATCMLSISMRPHEGSLEGRGLWAHYATKKDHVLEGESEPCELLVGGRCWGDGSMLAGDEVVRVIKERGIEAGWEKMEGFLEEWK